MAIGAIAIGAWLLAACNAPIPALNPAEPDAAGERIEGPTPTAESGAEPPATDPPPTEEPTPRPTAVPEEIVWYGPNMGSTDFAALFDRPAAWTEARSRVDVFKFYIQNVLDNPCAICGDNTLIPFLEVDAFRQLETWGLGTAVEAGTVKEWGCTGDQGFRNVDLAVRNIEAGGGKVSFLAMDEPLLGGQHVIDGRTCDLSVDEIAAGVANFVEQMETAHPEVVIGDIEPYPHYSVEELKAWIVALEEHGVVPAFFHLDVDIHRTRVEGQDVAADLAELQGFVEGRGVAFGVIFISNWREAGSNRAYYQSTMGWVERVEAAIGRPDHAIFQSWQGPAPSGAHEIPSNLPPAEGPDYSHTRLILDGLAVFDE